MTFHAQYSNALPSAPSNKPVIKSRKKGKTGAGSSLQLGKSEVSTTIVCDKISVIIGGLLDYHLTHAKGFLQKTALVNPYSSTGKVKYECSGKILLENGGVFHAQIGPDKGAGHQMRFEWNPGKLGNVGHEQLRQLMKELLPGGYQQLVAEGTMTRLDVAVDVHGLSPDDFMVTHSRKLICKEYSKGGRLETLYLGSETSDRFWRVYDKATQMKSQGGKKCTRIECANKLARPMRDVGDLNGLLSELIVVGKVGTKVPEGVDRNVWVLLRELLCYQALHKGLARLDAATTKTLKSYLKANKTAHWWHPNQLATAWPNHLRAIGLLDTF